MRRTTGRLILGILAVSAAVFTATPRAAAQSADDFRTWTDASGRFKVEAKFSAREGDTVILEKRDGSKLRIALDKLSVADREVVQQLPEANPFEPAEPSPFESIPGTGVAAPPAGGAADMMNFTVDWSQVPMLSLPGDESWEFRPGDAAVPTVAERTVPLPPKRDFFEKVNGAAINPAAMQGVVSYVLDRPGGKEASSRLVTWDIRAGRVVGMFLRPGKWAVLALDD
ncbi:MAG: hypothetical protein GYA33_16015, partial [Thermogutta sp.]|nr:hypothetical protein [Thermogutta sp.]